MNCQSFMKEPCTHMGQTANNINNNDGEETLFEK